MTLSEIVDWISQSNGKIFSIKFIKRSTGEERIMTCRTGVTSHLKGTRPGLNFKAHGLIGIFDMQKNAYRSIPIEGIKAIKIDGDWREVIHG